MLRRLKKLLKIGTACLMLSPFSKAADYYASNVTDLINYSRNSTPSDTVFVAQGNYLLNQDLNIFWGVKVKGDNKNSCIIDGNNQYRVYCLGSISDITVKNGKGDLGGGIYVFNGVVENCAITNCTANNSGGGIFSSGSIIKNTIVRNNNAAKNAGGVALESSQLINCLISGNNVSSTNSSEGFGGGVRTFEQCLLLHNTIVNNYSRQGGGVYVRKPSGSQTTLTNNIVYFNLPINCDAESGAARHSYTCTTPFTGPNCITSNPCFINSSSDNRLSFNSPCLDAGTNSNLRIDLEGKTRPVDGNADGTILPDIGCYEQFKKFSDNDYEGDGIPNNWETAHGTDPYNSDANEDPDNDGFNNYQEYLANTSPTNGNSYFRGLDIKIIDQTNLDVILLGPTSTDRTYRIDSSQDLLNSQWLNEYISFGNQTSLNYTCTMDSSNLNFRIFKGSVGLE